MKIQLKKFPNGARFIFGGVECQRLGRDASIIRVLIVGSDTILLLHPNTFVEPIELVENGK